MCVRVLALVVWGMGREGGAEGREFQADSPVGAESDVGLDLTIPGS